MTVKQLLVDARKLIERPENWTIRVMARDARDNEVTTDDADACKFCMLGAVRRANLEQQDDLKAHEARRLVAIIAMERYGKSIARTNDSVSHAEVLSIFDKAIEDCA